MVAANFADKTIWTGDNLDILRGLNSETVDLIYLDPPFNSIISFGLPSEPEDSQYGKYRFTAATNRRETW